MNEAEPEFVGADISRFFEAPLATVRDYLRDAEGPFELEQRESAASSLAEELWGHLSPQEYQEAWDWMAAKRGGYDLSWLRSRLGCLDGGRLPLRERILLEEQTLVYPGD